MQLPHGRARSLNAGRRLAALARPLQRRALPFGWCTARARVHPSPVMILVSPLVHALAAIPTKSPVITSGLLGFPGN
jgi:hypothetical protein